MQKMPQIIAVLPAGTFRTKMGMFRYEMKSQTEVQISGFGQAYNREIEYRGVLVLSEGGIWTEHSRCLTLVKKFDKALTKEQRQHSLNEIEQAWNTFAKVHDWLNPKTRIAVQSQHRAKLIKQRDDVICNIARCIETLNSINKELDTLK